MNVRSDLALAYMIGFDDAVARRKPDSSRAGVLNSYNCTSSEQTTTVDETETLHARGDTWGTKEFDKNVIVHVMECGACGRTYEHVNGSYEYCPHCGRRITGGGLTTFYNHIENVRTMAINLTHGEPWHGAIDKARVFDSLDAARSEYMQLQKENVKLRKLAARAWRLFTENGAVHPSDLPEVDAVRDGLRELGVEASQWLSTLLT